MHRRGKGITPHGPSVKQKWKTPITPLYDQPPNTEETFTATLEKSKKWFKEKSNPPVEQIIAEFLLAIQEEGELTFNPTLKP